MHIHIEKTNINDVFILKPNVFKDERGIFTELFKYEYLRNQNLEINVKQHNYSKSYKNILRGIHFQYNPPMGKLMRVSFGKAFLVAVDLRKNSSTLGAWVGREMSSDNIELMWAPSPFARGFCVLSDFAEIEYLCDNEYNKNGESGIKWNDTEVRIEWPVSNPIVSDKDQMAQTLSEWLKKPESNLF